STLTCRFGNLLIAEIRLVNETFASRIISKSLPCELYRAFLGGTLRRNNGLGRLNIPELALAAIPLLNEVAMSERSDSDACRYCREPLRVGASYCSNCKRFQ